MGSSKVGHFDESEVQEIGFGDTDYPELLRAIRKPPKALRFRGNLPPNTKKATIHATGHQLYHCYKRRMQIEHGFRDIKSCFGFSELVLKKPSHQRVAFLWLLACVTYGLLFLSYEKSATRWAKTSNGCQKRYSVINVIKRVIADVWHPEYLLSFFTQPRCRGDTLFDIY